MTDTSPRSRWRPGIVLVALVATYLLVGYLVVPIVASSQITKIVTAQTGLVPTLQKVRFDPLNIRLIVEGFELKEEAEQPPVLRFEKLVVDVRPIGFLTSDVALDEVQLVRPQLAAILNEQGELNLLRLLSSVEEPDTSDSSEASGADDSDPLIVDVARVRIEEGNVEFRDLSLEEPFSITLALLNLDMHDVSTRLGKASSYELNLSMGPSSRLKWVGTGQLSPPLLDGQIDLSDFDLTWPSSYLASRLQFEVVEGALSISTRYAASFEDGFDLTLSDGRVDLSDLSIVESDGVESRRGEEMLALPSVVSEGIEVSVEDLDLESVSLDRISLEGGRVLARLGEDGQLELLGRLTSTGGEGSDGGSGRPGAADSSTLSEAAPSTSTGDDQTRARPQIRVGELAIRDFTVDFEDRSLASPAAIRLKPLALTAKGFDSAPGHSLDFELEAATERGGSLKVAGPIVLDPLDVKLAVSLSEWPIAILDSYVRSAARANLSKGLLSSKLDVGVADVHTEGASTWSAKGVVQLDDLLVTDAKDASNLVVWKKLRLEGLDLGADRFEVDEIGLAGLVARVEIAADGKVNFQSVLEEGGGRAASDVAAKERAGQREKPAASKPAIRIDRFRLDDADIAFVDASISPTFRTELSSLQGTVDGLASGQKRLAKVAFQGVLDETAPLRVEGQINPLRSDLPSQIAISLTDLSMPIFAPYSRRYVGYGIDRGRLEMTLDYQLVERSLEASNRFRLERFAFGERSGSEFATSLPVPLAMGLMRDASGVIEIDLPITGNVDDPSFNVLGLLRTAFTQLITKVATAPFAAISGIVGFSADELSRVEFDPGSEELNDAERGKIDRLGEALAGKPELSIEIRGRADPEVDGFQSGTERGDEKGRALARARAASIRRAFLENSAIAPNRVFLVEVEIGNFGSEGVVPSELSLVGG